MQHVKVSSLGHHVGPVAKDTRHDAQVADEGQQDDARHDGDLLEIKSSIKS